MHEPLIWGQGGCLVPAPRLPKAPGKPGGRAPTAPAVLCPPEPERSGPSARPGRGGFREGLRWGLGEAVGLGPGQVPVRAPESGHRQASTCRVPDAALRREADNHPIVGDGWALSALFKATRTDHGDSHVSELKRRPRSHAPPRR